MAERKFDQETFKKFLSMMSILYWFSKYGFTLCFYQFTGFFKN